MEPRTPHALYPQYRNLACIHPVLKPLRNGVSRSSQASDRVDLPKPFVQPVVQ
jgi:hypothetical protein